MSSISGIFNLDGSASLADPTSVHRETGCVISADARIDYRGEVLAKLGLDSNALSDAEIILQAYLRWGEDCLDHLLGDFAFAIWDPRERKLFCARDRFGMRPFYYCHAPGKHFVFASDARAVFRTPEVPYAINAGRVADFLVPELEWIDYTSTFFEGVYRLPPAHKLTVTPSSFDITEYWSPDPGPALQFTSDADYCEGFREVFARAIEERRRGADGRVGAMLSGGMDSGSIVAMASPLPTYSLAQARDVDCEESQRTCATLKHMGLEGTQIIAGAQDSLIDELGSNLEEPYDGEFLFLRAIYEAARRDGCSVVLDGAAGDIVFNEGAYIARLMRHGRLRQAWHETAGAQAYWEQRTVLPAFLRHLRSAFVPEPIKQVFRPARQRKAAQGFVDESLIDPGFAKHVDIAKRFERMAETFAGIPMNNAGLARILKIRPNLTAGRERYARIATSASVTAADPFTDLRVVQFCAQLPDRICARDGWPKYLLRIAMEGRLPDTVRWGRGKPLIGWVYNELFIKREMSRGNLSLDSLRATLDGYVDPVGLQRAWERAEAGTDFESVHSVYVLSRWLDQFAARPL